MIPFVFLFLWNISKTTTSKIMTLIVSFCSACCLGISGMYHRCNLTKEQEIFIQKFDHACILIVAMGSYIPLVFYIMDKAFGIIFICFYILFTLIGFTWIMFGNETFIPLCLISLLGFPIFIYIYKKTNLHVFICSILVMISYGIGAYIFKFKKCDFFPEYFGYHEVFHLFVVISMIFTFYVHYHIIQYNSWFDSKILENENIHEFQQIESLQFL
jgi:hemolysin III